MMVELLNALELRDRYNRKTLDEIIKELEDYLGGHINKVFIEEWKITGLNNVDFVSAVLSNDENYPQWWKDMKKDRRHRQNEYCKEIFKD